ncbi:hypothetical protein [Streptomyces sp. NRRL F-5053]|uniref:hypothetical protein n=1 Tax=Streptomyces sp. NRRL F-5053 TaxID=1463854 RepID=UPI0004CA66CA|nr:hypothetical protein [Streptomyces sp. NRRL F-5053]
MDGNDFITDVLSVLGDMESSLKLVGWAESEIDKAMARHGEPQPLSGGKGGGPIWNSFDLLRPTHDTLHREILYRPHAHELLERVANDRDTRPGTDAEVIVALHEASLAAPITSAAACLYFRLLCRSLPELSRAPAPHIDLASYEHVHGRQADTCEDELRHRLLQDWRKK